MMLFSKTKLIFFSASLLAIVAFLVWLFVASSKPLPGQKQADQGRNHVAVGTSVEYNSNPPTSGPHYEDWIRAGVYEIPKDDRNLVHSLEHGYVILSYRCRVAPEGGMSRLEEATAGASPSGQFDTQGQCDERKNQLSKVYEKKGKRKLIVVARPNLDTNFALTAWNYLDKFDTIDGSRIEKFIDAHRDQGPERTME